MPKQKDHSPIKRVKGFSLKFTTFAYFPNDNGAGESFQAVCVDSTTWHIGEAWGAQLSVSDYELASYVRILKAIIKLGSKKQPKGHKKPKKKVIHKHNKTHTLTTDAKWRKNINPDGDQYVIVEAIQLNGGWLIGSYNRYLRIEQFAVEAYLDLFKTIKAEQKIHDKYSNPKTTIKR